MRTGWHSWPWLLALMLASGTTFAQEETSIRYTVSISGIGSRTLRSLVESVSDTRSLRDRPPTSVQQLRQRVARDVALFARALRSRAYYAGKVTPTVDEASRPARISFQVEPGPLYELRTIMMSRDPATAETAPIVGWPELGKLGLRSGMPAEARAILEGERKLLAHLGRQGLPLARTTNRKIVVDHDARAVDVTFLVEPGPRARFGPTAIKGLTSVNESFVRKLLPWKEGDSFDTDKLARVRDQLILSGVFAGILVGRGAETVGPDGRLPVEITLSERLHRTIEGGFTYRTDQEGAGVRLGWENRNMTGRADRLRVETALTGIGYEGFVSYRLPEYGRRDEALLLDVRAAYDRPEAYTSRNVQLSAAIERTYGIRRTFRRGLSVKGEDVMEKGGPRTDFKLLSAPVALDFDRSNDLLDPSEGDRIFASVTPYLDVFENNLGFVRALGRYSTYRLVDREPQLVLATRLALGAITGAERGEIPPDERFYAGGGSSVRGYGFQSLGPFDGGPQTLGGRSLLELSAEVRTKLTPEIGVVGFIDGGNAFLSEFPLFEDTLRWGLGAGVRYYTPIGPLRLDIAFPINGRRNIDAPYQLYLSVGQAF